MKNVQRLWVCCLGLMLLAACSEESDRSVFREKQTETFGLQTENWTYLNLSSGRVVGTSALGDTEADREWAGRTDWDMAVCGDLLRTNGGTSGVGQGALRLSDIPFEQLTAVPAGDWVEDTDTVTVW